MANILPSDWKSIDAFSAAGRICQTLTSFERNLPDDLTVFHGLHWSRSGNALASLGDLDFVVIDGNGHILLIEQKSGLLYESDEGLFKRAKGVRKKVHVHIDETLNELQSRLEPIRQTSTINIDYLLYCPDYIVKDMASAGLSPDAIVDSKHREQLCDRIQRVFQTRDEQADLARRLHRFFANELQLVPDASALIGRAQALVTKMSEGLATWARRIDHTPFRIHVSATAGSGKTQLALAELADADAKGKRALYLCFNRPLADHMRATAPDSAQVFTYHQWCQHRVRDAGETVEFVGPDVFDKIAERCAQLAINEDEYIDCLIIDEGQDFTPDWQDNVLRLVDHDPDKTRVWWLEDPMQDLYNRDNVSHPNWVRLNAPVNYRSPRTVVDFVNHAIAPSPAVIGAGPIEGSAPDFLLYDDADGLREQTKHAITLAMRAGFRRQDLALITFAGRERSAFHASDKLGPHHLRAFTGKYDLFGNPEFTEGEVLLDTVYRFKGQSAPCVILTEVEFDVLDERTKRKLFVGVTRAAMHLIVVLSRQAFECLNLPPPKPAQSTQNELP